MASNKKYYWLKLKSDFFEEKYIKALRRLPQGDSLVIVYLKMQLKSLKTEGLIEYEGILPNATAELAMLLDEDEAIVQLAVNALIKFGVIEKWDNDTFYLNAMQQLIGSESSSAERVRKHRMLQSNASALHCNTEIEKNTDKNVELNIREDIEITTQEDTVPQAEVVMSNCPYAKIKDLYHEICISYPKIKQVDGNRKKAVSARWRTYKTLKAFKEMFILAEASSFLKGENERNWKADFDWMMKATNFSKILENKYANRESRVSGALGELQRLYVEFEKGEKEETTIYTVE